MQKTQESTLATELHYQFVQMNTGVNVYLVRKTYVDLSIDVKLFSLCGFGRREKAGDESGTGERGERVGESGWE